MGGRHPLTERAPCERAREWASLRLDGELSPLEEELLVRHLETCEECRAFESNVRWATDVMRLTTAERPARRVAIPARPAAGRWAGPRRAALAAAAALALGALVGSTAQGPGPSEPGSPGQVSLVDADDLEDFPPSAPVPVPSPAPPPSPNPPEGVI